MVFPTSSIVVPNDTPVQHAQRTQTVWLAQPCVKGTGFEHLVSNVCTAGQGHRRFRHKLLPSNFTRTYAGTFWQPSPDLCVLQRQRYMDSATNAVRMAMQGYGWHAEAKAPAASRLFRRASPNKNKNTVASTRIYENVACHGLTC